MPRKGPQGSGREHRRYFRCSKRMRNATSQARNPRHPLMKKREDERKNWQSRRTNISSRPAPAATPAPTSSFAPSVTVYQLNGSTSKEQQPQQQSQLQHYQKLQTAGPPPPLPNRPGQSVCTFTLGGHSIRTHGQDSYTVMHFPSPPPPTTLLSTFF